MGVGVGGGSPGAKAKNLTCKVLFKNQHLWIWKVGEEVDWTDGKTELCIGQRSDKALANPVGNCGVDMAHQYCYRVTNLS